MSISLNRESELVKNLTADELYSVEQFIKCYNYAPIVSPTLGIPVMVDDCIEIASYGEINGRVAAMTAPSNPKINDLVIGGKVSDFLIVVNRTFFTIPEEEQRGLLLHEEGHIVDWINHPEKSCLLMAAGTDHAVVDMGMELAADDYAIAHDGGAGLAAGVKRILASVRGTVPADFTVAINRVRRLRRAGY